MSEFYHTNRKLQRFLLSVYILACEWRAFALLRHNTTDKKLSNACSELPILMAAPQNSCLQYLLYLQLRKTRKYKEPKNRTDSVVGLRRMGNCKKRMQRKYFIAFASCPSPRPMATLPVLGTTTNYFELRTIIIIIIVTGMMIMTMMMEGNPRLPPQWCKNP